MAPIDTLARLSALVGDLQFYDFSYHSGWYEQHIVRTLLIGNRLCQA